MWKHTRRVVENGSENLYLFSHNSHEEKRSWNTDELLHSN